MRIIYMLVTLLTGGWIALHVAMNAKVAKLTGLPFMANLAFWLCGAISAIIITLLKWDSSFFALLSPVPKWLFLAGTFGSMIGLTMNFMIPSLGVDNATMILLVGQLVAAMVLGHIGFMGSEEQGITLVRVLGCLIMLSGAAVVVYGRIPFLK